MDVAPPWVMRFRYLTADDAVVAEFENVELVTVADVQRWARDVGSRLKTFGRKVHLLIDLGGLKVRPGASREFGKARAQVLATFTLNSYRYNGDRATVTSVHTSSVLEHAASNVYASFEEARAAMLRERSRASA